MLKKESDFSMKKFIKKVSATTLSIFGILSAMPSAFCAPYGDDPSSKSSGESYSSDMKTNDTKQGKSKNLVYKFSEGSKKLFYAPYSFDADDFWKVLNENKVCENERLNKDWRREVLINGGDYMKGICCVFISGDKTITFLFDLCYGKELHSIKDYLNFLCMCNLGPVANSVLKNFYIPDCVEKVAKDAFKGCDVKKVSFNGKDYTNAGELMKDFRAYKASHKK